MAWRRGSNCFFWSLGAIFSNLVRLSFWLLLILTKRYFSLTNVCLMSLLKILKQGLPQALKAIAKRFEQSSPLWPFFFEPCGILVPWPGTEPGPSALKARSPNNCTTREFLGPLWSDWCCDCCRKSSTYPCLEGKIQPYKPAL